MGLEARPQSLPSPLVGEGAPKGRMRGVATLGRVGLPFIRPSATFSHLRRGEARSRPAEGWSIFRWYYVGWVETQPGEAEARVGWVQTQPTRLRGESKSGSGRAVGFDSASFARRGNAASCLSD